jgi:ATP-dependent DNA ligase
MRPYRGRRSFDVTDPIIEPFWSGQRVLAHVVSRPDADPPAEATLLEDDGVDVGAELADLTAAVAESVLALDAILDGVVTWQVGLDGVGAAAIPELRRMPAGMILRSSADIDVVPRGTEGGAGGAVDLGFVAVDLLRLDGTSLLDVPLLERKRLLESVVRPSQLVRVSTHVRPPYEPWLATWKAVGLRGAMLKAANSRYRPGDDTIEWRIVERLGRPR